MTRPEPSKPSRRPGGQPGNTNGHRAGWFSRTEPTSRADLLHAAQVAGENDDVPTLRRVSRALQFHGYRQDRNIVDALVRELVRPAADRAAADRAEEAREEEEQHDPTNLYRQSVGHIWPETADVIADRPWDAAADDPDGNGQSSNIDEYIAHPERYGQRPTPPPAFDQTPLGQPRPINQGEHTDVIRFRRREPRSGQQDW